jgi:galactosylceramidase
MLRLVLASKNYFAFQSVQCFQVLRAMLNKRGLGKVEIIGADLLPVDCWDIAKDVTRDSELSSAISILGCHYGGTESSQLAKDTNKPLWSSEDWSHVNDETGGGCMARVGSSHAIFFLV